MITKSASTRFQNSQVNAQRATMPFNQAAQQSLRNQTSKANPSGPPVGAPANSFDPAQLMGVAAETGPVQMPTGGPQMPPEASEQFDPEVFKENMIDELVGTIRTEQFINSPRVKDAVTSVRLKNFFNNSNPNRMPDPRNLLSQVLDRMKMRPD